MEKISIFRQREVKEKFMSQQISRPIFSVNNDRTAAFSAFRTPTPIVNNGVIAHDSVAVSAQAAHALPSQVAPKPTQLSDDQVDMALEQVQHQSQEALNAHGTIDPARVARLLSMLE